MSVKVRLSPLLQRFAGGKEVVETIGHTTGECLDDLDAQFPGIKLQICDERGQVSSSYEIYVNGKSACPEELTKPVNDGDEMSIIVILARGG